MESCMHSDSERWIFDFLSNYSNDREVLASLMSYLMEQTVVNIVFCFIIIIIIIGSIVCKRLITVAVS